MRVKLVLAILLMSQFVYGHNNYFIPGDAFFSSRVFSYDESKKELTVHYTFLKNSMMLCGHFGFRSMIISNVSDEDYRKLLMASRVLKSVKLKKEKSEFTKLFPVFMIYNKDFDVKNNLLLRYNEDIMKLQKKYRSHALYDEVRGKGLAEINWSKSLEVRLLKIEAAKIRNNRMGENEALKIDRKEVKFIIIPPSDLSEVAQKKDGAEVYIFDASLKRYVYKKGELTEKK